MASDQKHIVKTQEIGLRLPREDEATAWQHRLSRLAAQQLPGLIDEYCSRLSTPDVIHRIDTLEIDLGPIPSEQFERIFLQKFEEALASQLAGAIAQAERDTSAANAKTRSQLELLVHFLRSGSLPWWADAGRRTTIEESVQFLAQQAPVYLRETLQEELASPAPIQRLAAHLNQEAMLNLALLFFSPAQRGFVRSLFLLPQLMGGRTALSPRQLQFHFREAFLTALLSPKQEPFNELTFLRKLASKMNPALGLSYPALLQTLAQNATATPPAGYAPLLEWLRQLTEEISEGRRPAHSKRFPGTSSPKGEIQEKRPPKDIAKGPANVEGPEETQPGGKDKAEPESKAKGPLKDEGTEEAQPEGRDKAEPLEKVQKARIESKAKGLPKDEAGEQSPSKDGEKSRQIVEGREKTQATEKEPKQETPAALEQEKENPSYPPSAGEPEKEGHQEHKQKGKENLRAGEQSGRKESQDPESRRKKEKPGAEELEKGTGSPLPPSEETATTPKERWDADAPAKEEKSPPFRQAGELFPRLDLSFSQVEELYIPNAGLVILGPFLPHFFQALGYVAKGSFQDEATPHRAAGLLHYLATGEEELQEYMAPLLKVLCGIGLEEPLSLAYELTEAEKAEAHFLLQTVISYAPVLKNMSIDGFRGTFLLRNGILSARDGHWLVQVERETYDVVLERFPWHWGVVKLPWGGRVVEVEW